MSLTKIPISRGNHVVQLGIPSATGLNFARKLIMIHLYPNPRANREGLAMTLTRHQRQKQPLGNKTVIR
jgi:uncharacterized protein YneF (UPF0154 family)